MYSTRGGGRGGEGRVYLFLAEWCLLYPRVGDHVHWSDSQHLGPRNRHDSQGVWLTGGGSQGVWLTGGMTHRGVAHRGCGSQGVWLTGGVTHRG